MRVEDAPALNALSSFKAHVKDGKIYVTADPAKTKKENSSRSPSLPSTTTETPGKGVVIVGGGSGAIQTVQSLREVCTLLPIVFGEVLINGAPPRTTTRVPS